MAPASRAAKKPQKKAASKQAAKQARAKGASAAKAADARTARRPNKASPAPPRAAASPDLYSSLHALLHTMRLIEQHDEPLCSMHDELKRTGRLSAAQRRRLQQLVDELPAEDYQTDLYTLREAVAAA